MTDQEASALMRECFDCRVYAPEDHTHGCSCRQCTEEVLVIMVPTGTLDLGFGPVPLHTEFAVCPAHETCFEEVAR